jgi:hypothetical protein
LTDHPSAIERAHTTRKGHAASVRRQSHQRLRCVRPYRCMTNATESTAAFAALRTAKQPASPGGKSSDAGRAAVGAYSKAKDGGTLSRYYLLCENHRRRVRSCAVNFRTGLPKQRRNLGFLGGANKGCAPLRGAKARLSGHLSSLLLTFGLCQKSSAPGATPPESWKHQRSNKPTVAAIQNVPSNDHIPAQIEVRLHIIGVVRVVQNPIAVPLYLHPRIGL